MGRRLDRALLVLGTALIVVTAAGAALAGGNGAGEAAQTSGAAASVGRVTIKDFKYAPVRAQVKVGTKVTWTNADTAQHTATSDQGGAFDTGTLTQGQAKTVALTKPGTYAYHCDFHTFMTATIVVR